MWLGVGPRVRLGGSFCVDAIEDFLPLDRDLLGRFEAKSHLGAADCSVADPNVEQRHPDVVPDDDCFIPASAEYEHCTLTIRLVCLKRCVAQIIAIWRRDCQ